MIAAQTFARYAALRVPRYTSYPTAPNFAVVEDDRQHQDWLRALPPAEPVSLYLHVPFCRQMCWYCGCHTSVARRSAPVDRYVERLADEIALVSGALPGRLTVGHLHWGGGTPTLLDPQAIALVDRRLRSHFAIPENTEVGLEVDPRTLTADVAAAFARSGVNRVSIGIQTFDPLVQRAINRVQPFDQTAAAVGWFRKLGVRGVNFDLIYGLPQQTTRSCIDTVEQALSLRPDRLAIFGYAHVPALKPHQRRIAEPDLPSSELRREQAQAMSDRLVAAGYRQIGIDHFALPGDPLAIAARDRKIRRNFQGYTTDQCLSLIGFGASAISRLAGGFVQNATRIRDYQGIVDQGRLPTVRICSVSADDTCRGAIIERLMCDYRADIGGQSWPALEPLERDGLVHRQGPFLEVVEEARPLIRVVAAAFDAYLPQSAARHVTAI